MRFKRLDMTFSECQNQIPKQYKVNLKTKYITIHVSATKEGVDIGRKEINTWHLNKGWSGIGYHYVVRIDGTLEVGRSESKIGAHVRGFNRNNIGICIIGGLDKNYKPIDSRTYKQKETLESFLRFLKLKHPNATIQGHRDFSPDRNGNGIVEPFEWTKHCPCFNAKLEYGHI